MSENNPVPQWAVDAAKAHHQPIFDLFPDDLGEREEAVHALAAIIARHAPDHTAKLEEVYSVCRENVISARIIRCANNGRSYEIERDARFILERTEKVLPPRESDAAMREGGR